ncbi:uncharacterized protein ACRADG_008901 [Cochliomyia hominivorax]
MKDNLRKSRVSRNTNSENNHPEENKILPQRIFLYLKPITISYPLDDVPCGRAEIELTHCNCKITTLCDHFVERNFIKLDDFDQEKPTFSITIEQDNIEEINVICDSPIVLTLYVYTKSRTINKESSEFVSAEGEEEDVDICIPVAQGYIDILEYFNTKRCHNFETIYLYPLKTFGQNLACKTEWEIYSLHPLLKNLTFSNILFITLGSLYNIDSELLNEYQNLVANFSFISKQPNEHNEYDKIFICKFKTFTKSIIVEQNLCKKWESLKNQKIDNYNCIGIATESKFHLNQLLANLLITENVELNTAQIDIAQDFALVGNSIHRYVFTDAMQKVLEDVLACNQYQIIVEFYLEQEENKILLQGYVDLSVFMYPQVKYCSFAIELRSPDQVPILKTSKNGKQKRKSKNGVMAQQSNVNDQKIPFVVVQICLSNPITNPPQNMLENLKQKRTHHKYDHCSIALTTKTAPKSLQSICEEKYKDFDDLIREIMDYMIRSHVKIFKDNNDYFCCQLSNMTNKIIKLVACDFNVRIPTKTNIEFTNLLTTVYRELTSRIFVYINKCNIKGLEDCKLTNTNIQNFILTNISTYKYLFEVGNFEMADFIMKNLMEEYPNNSLMNFYIFLYDIERQNFESVKEYLAKPLQDKNNEGELFSDLIQIYVNYKLQLQDLEQYEQAEEDLFKAFTYYNTIYHPKSLTGWILLYCLYKKYNYEPGMTYCRWTYENLYDSFHTKLEFIPKSRWEIYMPYQIQLKTLKGQNYIKIFQQLLRLGLYTFAEWVFEEISAECMEIEKYFTTNTFLILNNKNSDNVRVNTFSMDQLKNSPEMRATLLLVNGNLEHFRLAKCPASIKNYQDIMELEDIKDFQLYQLGVFRFAYYMMDEKEYEKARQAFLYCFDDTVNSFVAGFEGGKACYCLNQLDEAEKYFAFTTKCGIYMPNIWAYLALINLKKGNNSNALECWKFAKLNQNTEIHEEILNELNQINYSDIFLYVEE